MDPPANAPSPNDYSPPAPYYSPPSPNDYSPPPPSDDYPSPPPSDYYPPPPPPVSASSYMPPPAHISLPSPKSGSPQAQPPVPSYRNIPLSHALPPSSSSSGTSLGVLVGVVISVIVVLIIIGAVLFVYFKKKKKTEEENNLPPISSDLKRGSSTDPQKNTPTSPASPASPAMLEPLQSPGQPLLLPFFSSGGSASNSGSERALPVAGPGLSLSSTKSTFTYEELEMATDGFSAANLLGYGGFGYVHRGVLPDGKEVAVKRLKVASRQGDREFVAEVETISRVHHRHLVSLVGYCITGSHRILVYHFVPNKTLEYHLHEKCAPSMDCPTRLKIALGSAKGLAYLHEDCYPKIIHRDIKTSNILLDFNFEAKVADFGLAKTKSEVNTHISTRVMGTFGYLAPEYASSGKLTEKSDVFSFGVVLLELITGRRPVETTDAMVGDSLVDWARPVLTRALEEGNFDSLVDPRMEKDYSHNDMARLVSCAAACISHFSKHRPRMIQIVRALERNASFSDLNEGRKSRISPMYSSDENLSYDPNQYNEEMKKFLKVALSIQEHGSGEHSSAGLTSDYGLNPSISSSEGQTSTEMGMGEIATYITAEVSAVEALDRICSRPSNYS